MTKKRKFGLGIGALAIGLLVLTGCTNSFCNSTDKAYMLYEYDNGVTAYYSEENKPVGTTDVPVLELEGYPGVYYTISFDNNKGGLNDIYNKAGEAGIECPNIKFWAEIDKIIFSKVVDNTAKTADQINFQLNENGYLKFTSDKTAATPLWDNWDTYYEQARAKLASIDQCPTLDFLTLYKYLLSLN